MNKQGPLPDGWRWARLGELCRLVNGSTYKESDWSSEGIPIIRIQNLNDDLKPFNYWAGEINGRVAVQPGNVLLAWSGTPGTSFGVHKWERGLGVLNQHIFRLDFHDAEILPDWAVIAINHKLEILIGKAHGGVGLRHVTKGEVESLEIPLPPVEEQKRIAAILNEQMGAVERARAAAEAQLEAAKALPAAYLHAVFSSPEAHKWYYTNIGSISDLVIDGPHVTPSYVPNGVPFLTVRNIVKRQIDLSDVSYITPEDHSKFSRRGKAERGDILYTKDGTMGIPCVVEDDLDFSFFVSVALIKLMRKRAHPRFVAFALESPAVLKQVEKLGAGAGLKHMVLKSIRLLGIPLPSLPEQQRIAAILNEQMASADRARKAIEEELNAINKLPAGLLRRAFTGGL